MHITNKISNLFHKFATKEFPKSIQNFINNGYVNLLGLDMKEFDAPSSYKTLNQLFTRELKIEREYSKDENTFISPADSFVSESGNIENETACQIKGMKYSVKELLTQEILYDNFEKLKNGTFMNFYLSPKDYHRYHASFDCQITKLIHVPGKLYPVNFTYLKKQTSLFVENERVILECKTKENKLFYMVFVGALNVGKMIFTFEPKVNTNVDAIHPIVYEYDDLYITKADCLGYFEMGSTVLMFWEKDMVEIENNINTKVRFGDVISTIVDID
ncbi:phosphatidylserine decarboxylase [Arcobacter sp. 15-2]|uniref:phosphatidylserine decarboxylase n=1 Tax=Arcobacter sp. 15-2 TaxID=3374109 RepID=UPI00399CD964